MLGVETAGSTGGTVPCGAIEPFVGPLATAGSVRNRASKTTPPAVPASKRAHKAAMAIAIPLPDERPRTGALMAEKVGAVGAVPSTGRDAAAGICTGMGAWSGKTCAAG
jgi:hypothetical protein